MSKLFNSVIALLALVLLIGVTSAKPKQYPDAKFQQYPDSATQVCVGCQCNPDCPCVVCDCASHGPCSDGCPCAARIKVYAAQEGEWVKVGANTWRRWKYTRPVSSTPSQYPSAKYTSAPIYSIPTTYTVPRTYRYQPTYAPMYFGGSGFSSGDTPYGVGCGPGGCR